MQSGQNYIHVGKRNRGLTVIKARELLEKYAREIVRLRKVSARFQALHREKTRQIAEMEYVFRKVMPHGKKDWRRFAEKV